MFHRFRVFPFVLATLFALTLAMSAAAQFNAGIQGTVLDPKEAAVPGAKVTVTNDATGVNYETTSSESGFYRIAGLPPGTYTVTIEAQGFKKRVVKEVVVDAEKLRGLEVALELGAVQETVTVTAEQAALQTETASIATSITREQIRRLPQTGRDTYELLRLAPGIFGDGARAGNGNSIGFPNSTGPGGSNASIFQVENQVPISANGQRVSANNFTIDGVNVNSLGFGGAAVVTPNQESVEEVTVLSSSYSAEDGRNSGAQIKVVSKSGGNEFHGSALFRYAEPGLNAFRYGGRGAPEVRVNNKQRQFGGSIGGPIVKEKLFFFFSYEGVRASTNDTINRFVETPQFRQAIQSSRSGSVTATILSQPGIEPRIISPIATNCTNFTNQGRPCAVLAGGLDIGSLTGATNQYVLLSNAGGGGLDGIPDIMFAQIAVPNRQRGDQYNSRVDWNLGENRFAVSTYFTKRNDLQSDGAAQGRPMADLTFKPLNSAAAASWIRTISSNMLNEARFNFTRFTFNQIESTSGANFAIPRVEVEGLPINDRIRFGVNRAETTPGAFAQNTFTFRDVFSWNVRSHAMKFGFDLTREQDNNNLVGGARPLYSFVGLWNLGNGTPIFEAVNTDPRTGQGGDAQRYFRTNDYGLFIQDDWKFRPNLTFTLGLRYEYFTPLREKRGLLTNLALAGSGPQALDQAGVVALKELFQPDRNNFAPRLGFAWSPTKFESKLVVRGGFGVAFNRVHNVLFANTRGNVPFFARFNICCGTTAVEFGEPFVGGQILYATGSSNSILSYPANPVLVQPLNPTTNLPTVGRVEIWGTPRETPNAYVYTYSFEGEYALPWNLVTTLGYQGSSSHKLIRIVNQNFIFDDLNEHIFQAFFPTPDVNASFSALNARVIRRFAQGYQFSFQYRYSKSIDQLSSEGPGFVTNQTFPRDQRTERGPSDYDATHSVVFSGLWDLPILRNRSDWIGKAFGGWQINGFFTFHSGFPWTPVSFNRCLQFPGGSELCPTRPIAFLGGSRNGHGNDTFLRPNGNFPGGGTVFFDDSASSPPGIGRNTFRGPRFSVFDLSFVKETRLPTLPFFGEGSRITFRADFFNAFNQLNLQPFGFSSASTVIRDGRFGEAERGLAGRVIEFHLRFSF